MLSKALWDVLGLAGLGNLVHNMPKQLKSEVQTKVPSAAETIKSGTSVVRDAKKMVLSAGELRLLVFGRLLLKR
eukprot:5077458-Amphidinium_carterae.1